MPETFRTFYADPGEDFGWCLGRDCKLLAGGTHKMWDVPDALWDTLNGGTSFLDGDQYARDGVTAEENTGPIGRIVCEDFRIYPWKVNELKYDRVRTARVIGALTFIARQKQIPLILQGANIKKAAVAAGAEELYWRPLHENRHANDACQHFVFFTNVELKKLPLPVPDSVSQESYE